MAAGLACELPDSTKVRFLNIELFTNDVVNAASEEVNLLIFNSFVPDYDVSHRKSLQHLDANKTGSGSNKSKHPDLRRNRISGQRRWSARRILYQWIMRQTGM